MYKKEGLSCPSILIISLAKIITKYEYTKSMSKSFQMISNYQNLQTWKNMLIPFVRFRHIYSNNKKRVLYIDIAHKFIIFVHVFA